MHFRNEKGCGERGGVCRDMWTAFPLAQSLKTPFSHGSALKNFFFFTRPLSYKQYFM